MSYPHFYFDFNWGPVITPKSCRVPLSLWKLKVGIFLGISSECLSIVCCADQRRRVEGGTELNVTGLTPFVSYTFSVTAENSVSSQDPNTAVRTVSVSVTTLEGGMLSHRVRQEVNIFSLWIA